MPDPGLMPLPDAAADLDWSNLVDAAKAYEGESTEDRSRQRRAGRATLRCGPCECSAQVSSLGFFGHTDSTCPLLAQPEMS